MRLATSGAVPGPRFGELAWAKLAWAEPATLGREEFVMGKEPRACLAFAFVVCGRCAFLWWTHDVCV